MNIVTSQPQTFIQNQQQFPVQIQQTQQVVRKGIVTFHGQSQSGQVSQVVPQVVSQAVPQVVSQAVPQISSTPYQATKTTSVYVTPQVLSKLNIP